VARSLFLFLLPARLFNFFCHTSLSLEEEEEDDGSGWVCLGKQPPSEAFIPAAAAGETMKRGFSINEVINQGSTTGFLQQEISKEIGGLFWEPSVGIG